MVDVGKTQNTVEFVGTMTASGMVYQILVNGADIANMVTAIRIAADSENTLPRVTLILSPHVLKTSPLIAEIMVRDMDE
jgi:hypothetical protein